MLINKKIKASFTVEASVVTSAAILIMAGVIMFGISLRGRTVDMCKERMEEAVERLDVMNGRKEAPGLSFERAPEILYKYRIVEKAVE